MRELFPPDYLTEGQIEDEPGMTDKEFKDFNKELKEKTSFALANRKNREMAELNRPTRFYLIFPKGKNIEALSLLQDDRLYEGEPFVFIEKPVMNQIDPKRPDEGIFLESSQVTPETKNQLRSFFERNGLPVTEIHPVQHELKPEPSWKGVVEKLKKQGEVIPMKKPKQKPEVPDFSKAA